jgi:hypothetical protein
MAVSQDGIQVGKCYLAEPGDVVFLVLAIDHDDKVRHEVRTRVAGGVRRDCGCDNRLGSARATAHVTRIAVKIDGSWTSMMRPKLPSAIPMIKRLVADVVHFKVPQSASGQLQTSALQ